MRKKERGAPCKTQVTMFCNLILEVDVITFTVFHWLLGPTYTQGEGITQEYEYKEVGIIGNCIRSSLTTNNK